MLYVKVEEACLECKDKDGFICNEAYANNKNNIKSGVNYSVYKDNIVRNMQELIEYCLHWGEDVIIPKEYKVTKLYSIVFTTSDFEPEDRRYSRSWSNVILTTTDKNHAQSVYDSYCHMQNRGKEIMKNVYCWHTEDFARNQIIHSYSLKESYLVEKVK